MKLTQSLVAIAALGTLASTLSFAGGDINPITVFEQEPVVVPVEPVPTPKAPPPPPPPPAAPVVAKPLGLYIAGGITDVSVNTTDRASFFSDKVNQDRQAGLTGRIGYDFMDYLGAELRGTYGATKENLGSSKFKQVGAYLKPNYSVTDELNLYGLVGASKTNVGVGSQTGLSYGAGLNYDVAESVSVFTDVVNYMKKSNSPSQWGLTLGAAYNF